MHLLVGVTVYSAPLIKNMGGIFSFCLTSMYIASLVPRLIGKTKVIERYFREFKNRNKVQFSTLGLIRTLFEFNNSNLLIFII